MLHNAAPACAGAASYVPVPATLRLRRGARSEPPPCSRPLIEQEGEVGNTFGSATRALAQVGRRSIRKRTNGELTMRMTVEGAKLTVVLAVRMTKEGAKTTDPSHQ